MLMSCYLSSLFSSAWLSFFKKEGKAVWEKFWPRRLFSKTEKLEEEDPGKRKGKKLFREKDKRTRGKTAKRKIGFL